jgi:hypothetical protein
MTVGTFADSPHLVPFSGSLALILVAVVVAVGFSASYILLHFSAFNPAPLSNVFIAFHLAAVSCIV